MKQAYRVNRLNASVAFLTAVLLLCLAMAGFTVRNYWLAAFFLLLGVAFLVVGSLNASTLCLEDHAVTRRLFGKKLKEIDRSNLKEVGVVGIKVFGDKKKTGTKYIYFSDHEMNDKERFQMCVSWPPKDALYMVWGKKRYEAIRNYWDSTIEEYNTGDEAE